MDVATDHARIDDRIESLRCDRPTWHEEECCGGRGRQAEDEGRSESHVAVGVFCTWLKMERTVMVMHSRKMNG